MITKEQIEKAANDAYGRYSEAETSGFIIGAEWAVEQMQAENARLVELLKNAAADIDNLKSICDEAIKEARSHVYENERLRAAIQSALTRLENGYNRGAMSALLEAIEK